MVKLNKIYTRTGDDGTTGLGDGSRRRKDDPRVAAYGSIDETNSALGLARLSTAGSANGDLAAIDRVLARAQNDLFDLGADLCMPAEKRLESAQTARAPLRVAMSQVKSLEKAIDELNADHSRGLLAPTEFSHTTLSMHFYDSIVVFEKGRHGAKSAPQIGGPPAKTSWLRR